MNRFSSHSLLTNQHNFNLYLSYENLTNLMRVLACRIACSRINIIPLRLAYYLPRPTVFIGVSSSAAARPTPFSWLDLSCGFGWHKHANAAYFQAYWFHTTSIHCLPPSAACRNSRRRLRSTFVNICVESPVDLPGSLQFLCIYIGFFNTLRVVERIFQKQLYIWFTERWGGA